MGDFWAEYYSLLALLISGNSGISGQLNVDVNVKVRVFGLVGILVCGTRRERERKRLANWVLTLCYYRC